MKKAIICIIYVMMIANIACKKKDNHINQKTPDFSRLYSIEKKYLKDSSTLEIAVKLDSTLHAYGPGEKIGIPVGLKIADKNGWQADGPTQVPKAKAVALDGVSESHVLSDEFSLKQKVKAGKGPIEALLFLQVCTKNACDRPRTHVLTIEP